MYKLKEVNIKNQANKEIDSRVNTIIESKISIKKYNKIRTLTDNLPTDRSENIETRNIQVFKDTHNKF